MYKVTYPKVCQLQTSTTSPLRNSSHTSTCIYLIGRFSLLSNSEKMTSSSSPRLEHMRLFICTKRWWLLACTGVSFFRCRCSICMTSTKKQDQRGPREAMEPNKLVIYGVIVMSCAFFFFFGCEFGIQLDVKFQIFFQLLLKSADHQESCFKKICFLIINIKMIPTHRQRDIQRILLVPCQLPGWEQIVGHLLKHQATLKI